MPRLFIALTLPEDVRERLLAVALPELPEMRRIGAEESHLTLHFLGAVESVDVVRSALQRIETTAFSIVIQGVGTFGPAGQATTLWAGVQPNPALSALHQAVGEVLTEAI